MARVLIAAMCNQAAGAVTIRRSTHQAQFTRAITPLSTLHQWHQERHQGKQEPPCSLHGFRVPDGDAHRDGFDQKRLWFFTSEGKIQPLREICLLLPGWFAL